jgi:glycine betaine/choline ABC-type transport system substrate-binding protein
MRKAQMHYHQAEVVRESVCDKEPRTREILKPYLRLVSVSPIHEG